MTEIPQRNSTPRPLWREALGKALRLRRTDLGLTLSQVSRRSGVSTQFLSEVERGLKDPSSEVIEAVTIALGLEVPDVLVLTSLRMQQGFLHASGLDEPTAQTATMAPSPPRSPGRTQLSLVA